MVKRAIVLGGGGARGPYQVGVWRALRELGIGYQIVTGTSVGALNGALMVQGDYDTAYRLWSEITTKDVIANAPEPDEDPGTAMRTLLLTAAAEGGLDISPLEHKIRMAVDEDAIRASAVEFGVVAAQYPLLRPVAVLKEEIPQGELVDYLLASSSWFPFFRRRTIGEAQYIDGAYTDNLPAKLALRCGAEEIIAVDLQGAGIVHTFKEDIPVRYIRCHWNLGEMLLFEPETAKRNMQLGYLDCMKAYRRLEGHAYAFPPGDTRRNVLLLRRALEDIRRRCGVTLYKLRERLPRVQALLGYRAGDNRFLRAPHEAPTLGCALTTAAEITAELLQIPPDRIWRLRQLNKQILAQAGLHPAGGTDLFPADAVSRRSRRLLGRLLQLLREGYAAGRMPERFWGMAAVSPIEFVAANYLFALELHYGQRVRSPHLQ